MKKLSMLLLLTALSLTPIRAQTIPATANLTASDSGACTTAGACLTVNVTPSSAAAVIQLTGTFSATLQFEGTTSSGGTFVAIAATPVAGGSAVTSATATGSWRVTASGFAQIRVRCSAFTSGTVVAAITLSTGSSGTGNSSSGGAVSSVFGRTGAVAAASNDYTCAQVTNCTATPAWSTLTASANTNTGLFSMAQPGTFTNAAQNETTTFSLTGGSSCSISTILNGNGGTTVGTDALAGCANIPAGASVTNGFTTGVAGYVNNGNSSSLGQFGKAEGVGLYGVCFSAVSSSKCEGIVAQAVEATGKTGVQLIGSEIDVGTNDTSTTGFGYYTQFSGSGQPTGDNLPAYYVAAPQGAATYTTGFECADGSVVNTSQICLRLGQVSAGASNSSNAIGFKSTDSGSVVHTSNFQLPPDNVMLLASPAMALNNSGGEESYGIEMKATAATPHGTLVKIDTANADSFVICTTTDAICNGFVEGTNSASGLCFIASANCPVATVAGSKVQGILGTGTCAIGNWVIPDTTTNGDVKCATTQPIAWQGFALAANSSLGTAFDVLVSPGGASNVNAKTFSTATNCAAIGTAASPSVAACGSAAAGHFSCATNATGATCTVNTTAVTANSEIFVFESDTTVTGTALGVTCNTSTTVNPATRLLASSVAATSFTINLGTVTTNPACFSYHIVN
jgi:hypothetical protein